MCYTVGTKFDMRFQMSCSVPSVGSLVTVLTKYRDWVLGQEGIKLSKTVGKVVKNPNWLGADYFCVETGNKMHPIAMIHTNRVESIKLTNGIKLQIQDFPVVGSKGKMYTVKKSNGSYSCNCTGFEFHGKCKHIQLVKEDVWA
jgi:hypothetical protein